MGKINTTGATKDKVGTALAKRGSGYADFAGAAGLGIPTAAEILASADIETEQRGAQRAAFESDYRAANLELGKRRDAQSRLIPEPRHILSKQDWARKFHPKNSRSRRLPAETIQRMERDYEQYTQRIRFNNDADLKATKARGGGGGRDGGRRRPKNLEELAVALLLNGESLDNRVVKLFLEAKGIGQTKAKKLKGLMGELKAKWVSGKLKEAGTDPTMAQIREILDATGGTKREPTGARSRGLVSAGDVGKRLYGDPGLQFEGAEAFQGIAGAIQAERKKGESGAGAWLTGFAGFATQSRALGDDVRGQYIQALGGMAPFYDGTGEPGDDAHLEAIRVAFQAGKIDKETATSLIEALQHLKQVGGQ